MTRHCSNWNLTFPPKLCLHPSRPCIHPPHLPAVDTGVVDSGGKHVCDIVGRTREEHLRASLEKRKEGGKREGETGRGMGRGMNGRGWGEGETDGERGREVCNLHERMVEWETIEREGKKCCRCVRGQMYAFSLLSPRTFLNGCQLWASRGKPENPSWERRVLYHTQWGLHTPQTHPWCWNTSADRWCHYRRDLQNLREPTKIEPHPVSSFIDQSGYCYWTRRKLQPQ